MIHLKGKLEDLITSNKTILKTNNRHFYYGVIVLVNPISVSDKLSKRLEYLKQWKRLDDTTLRPGFVSIILQTHIGQVMAAWAIDYRNAPRRSTWPSHPPLTSIPVKHLNAANKYGPNWQFAKADPDAIMQYISGMDSRNNYIFVLPPFYGDKRAKEETIQRLEALRNDGAFITPQGPRVPTHQLVLNPATNQYSVQNVVRPSPAPAVPQ